MRASCQSHSGAGADYQVGTSTTFVAETFIPSSRWQGVDHLAVDVEFLILGDLELLVCVVFECEDHRVWWIDIPDLPVTVWIVVTIIGWL